MRALLHFRIFVSICWLGQAMADMLHVAREYRQVLPQFSQGQEIGNKRLIPIAHLLAGLSFLTSVSFGLLGKSVVNLPGFQRRRSSLA